MRFFFLLAYQWKALYAYDYFQYCTVILPLLWHPCVLPLEVHKGKAWHWALLRETAPEGPTYTYTGLWTDSKKSDGAEGNNTFTVNTAYLLDWALKGTWCKAVVMDTPITNSYYTRAALRAQPCPHCDKNPVNPAHESGTTQRSGIYRNNIKLLLWKRKQFFFFFFF